MATARTVSVQEIAAAVVIRLPRAQQSDRCCDPQHFRLDPESQLLRSFGKTRPTCLTGDGLNIALHGDDHTKAVKRAVQDALHRSSLSLFRSLKIDPNTMEIELRLAAQEPDKIDLEAVAETLPYGKVSPVAVTGGLNVPDGHNGRQGVIVNAGVIVRLPV